MNWDALAALGSLAAVIAVVISAAITHGKLTERVDQAHTRLDKHDIRFEDHEDRFDKHQDHLTKVDIALVKIEEYNRGIEVGVRISDKK